MFPSPQAEIEGCQLPLAAVVAGLVAQGLPPGGVDEPQLEVALLVLLLLVEDARHPDTGEVRMKFIRTCIRVMDRDGVVLQQARRGERLLQLLERILALLRPVLVLQLLLVAQGVHGRGQLGEFGHKTTIILQEA